jgi:cell wall-associated NlpC family hydrolase
VDGLTAVQSRIGEITARMTGLASFTPSSSGWAAAASAAGLTGTPAATVAASAGGTLGSTSTPGSTSDAGTAVVADARRYLGVPYRWGGTDPATGLDCSGLVQRVYRDLGVSLPRTSSQQATAGRAVASLADARPGDLVFFDNDASRAGVDHVGIYVGNGRMIAAPERGDVVKEQSVGTPSLIRRVLPESAGTTTATAGATLAGVPYADLFTSAGARYGVDPAVLAAMAKQESGFDPSAVSSAGAQGLMQFMPSTARGLGVDALDPVSAVDGAARYLSTLQRRFGSTEMALAAYNAGPSAVEQAGGVPAYAETRAYVRAVTTTAGGYR